MKDYQKMLDTLTNVPTGNGFVGDFSKYRESLLSLQELVDKEKPMKPLPSDKPNKVQEWFCPRCKAQVYPYPHYDYCPECGQHLDWEGKK